MATLRIDHSLYSYEVPQLSLHRNLRYRAGDDLPLDPLVVLGWQRLSEIVSDEFHGDWQESDQARDFWITFRSLILQSCSIRQGSIVVRAV